MDGRLQTLAQAIAQILEEVRILQIDSCLTRVRIDVEDISEIDLPALKKLDGVYGVSILGDQLQLIIGEDADRIAQALRQKITLTETDEEAEETEEEEETLEESKSREIIQTETAAPNSKSLLTGSHEKKETAVWKTQNGPANPVPEPGLGKSDPKISSKTKSIGEKVSRCGSRIMHSIVSCMVPLLPVLIACGLLKSLISILGLFPFADTSDKWM